MKIVFSTSALVLWIVQHTRRDLKYQQGHEPRFRATNVYQRIGRCGHKLDKSQGILKEKALRVEGMDDNTYEKHVAPMILKHDIDVDLDSTTFLIFQTFGSLLNQIDSLERHWARERFFRVGECMRVMYNSIRLKVGTHLVEYKLSYTPCISTYALHII